MSRRHFQDIIFEDAKLPKTRNLGEPGFREERRMANDVAGELQRTTGLREYMWDIFREHKVLVEDPEVRDLIIKLKETASNRPELYQRGERRIIYADVEFDTWQLPDLPKDNALLGELYIGWIEQALETLACYPQLPFELIRTQIETYRDSGYTYRYKIGERMIPGTKLKGRIDGELACVGLTRTLTVSYRKMSLFSKVIDSTNSIPTLFYRFFSRFEMRGDILFVQRLTPLSSDTLIDLNEYPEAIEILKSTS